MGQGRGVFDLVSKQDLNRGFGDALATAFELALTPAIMALIGWKLDAWLGTTPAFLLFFFLFTMSYEIWKMFKRYDARMQAEQSKITGLRPDPRAGEEPGS